jgi:hypothetical protein
MQLCNFATLPLCNFFTVIGAGRHVACSENRTRMTPMTRTVWISADLRYQRSIFFAKRAHSAIVMGAGRHVAYCEINAVRTDKVQRTDFSFQ